MQTRNCSNFNYGKLKLYDLYTIWLLNQKTVKLAGCINENEVDMEVEESDESDDDIVSLELKYKPVSKSFWYSVVNNVIFSEVKAQNCCCSTCLTAKQLFPEYFRLFVDDCRALHSLVQKEMLLGENNADIEAKLCQLEVRMPDEETFFNSNGYLTMP